MPRLQDRTPVNRPPEQTKRRLEEFFLALRGQDGVARLRLRVPTDGPTRGLSIDREVRVEARRTRGEASLDDLTLISWMPEGTGVFPTFEGILIIRGKTGSDVSSVELDGSYTPPYGVAGQVFDAAIGRRIAQATAREFLKDVKAAIER
jgi:hypothetical protein